MIVIGGISTFSASPIVAIALIIAGIPVMLWGKSISDKKAFKVWWKKVVEANLIPEIVNSTHTAIAVYNQNPNEYTLKKIAELNPTAAAQIHASIAASAKK